MKLLAFAVFDSAAGVYMRPFFAESRGLALRSFSDAVNDGESPVSKHPKDYTLFYIGSYEQDKGSLEPEVPVAMGNALEFVNSPNKE